MLYPKTINEVAELETQLIKCGLSPSEYFYITLDMKVKIHAYDKKNEVYFENKMLKNIERLHKVLDLNKKVCQDYQLKYSRP